MYFLPLDSSEGCELQDWLTRQVGDEAVEEVLSFLRQWNRLREERREQGRDEEPELEDYVQRWHKDRTQAARELGLFRLGFPGKASPGLVLDELWSARGRGIGDPLNARVVPEMEPSPF